MKLSKCNSCGKRVRKNSFHYTRVVGPFVLYFDDNLCVGCVIQFIALFDQVAVELENTTSSGTLAHNLEELIKRLDKCGFEVEDELSPAKVVAEFLKSL